MKVVIVGCGKVGKTIAEELVKENHDIILIDENAELVEDVSNSLDVIGVIGNGASLNILKEAGIETADVLIAVTSADEINMLCCLFAKKANKDLKTNARVRNPIYSSELSYIKDELGLTMILLLEVRLNLFLLRLMVIKNLLIKVLLKLRRPIVKISCL